MKSINNKVGIVVVTYNRLNLLKEVIDSLRNQTYREFDIVVVNNGSNDGTKEWLDSQEDIISIHQGNTGGAGGFFSGLKYVAENDYQYCWLMDDDVICDKDALQELITAYEVKPNIGFVCSAVRGLDGCPMNTPTVDQRPSPNGYPYFYDLIDRQMIKVRYATFVSVLLSTKTIREVGLPYKEYFIWGDDYEYTQRISLKQDCYMACKSKVLHKRSIQGALSFETETNPARLKNYFYMFRNTAYNHKKYNGKRAYYRFLITLTIKMIKNCVSFNFKKANILFKALSSVLRFNPVVQFPECLKS